MVDDGELLLAVLNSAPREHGAPTERLVGPEGEDLARRLGGRGGGRELAHLRTIRAALQDLIRGNAAAAATLQAAIAGATLTPRIRPTGIDWQLTAAPELMPAAKVVQAWSQVIERFPGRLKACANDECNLFLLDRTRPGTAKWCSMATCGNRMKARSHAARKRGAPRQGG